MSAAGDDPLASMKRAYRTTMALAAVGFFITCRLMLYTEPFPTAWLNFALCGWIGIFDSYALIRITEYFTDYSYAPVKSIVEASKTGHGTNVIQGIAVGLQSTAPPVAVIVASIFASYSLGRASGMAPDAAGVYGCAICSMGMLSTAVYVLSQNNFGPIADNAGGIVEMSGQPHQCRVITDRLDAVGNVTKAASKGYAVGGAALSSFVLFQAMQDEINEALRHMQAHVQGPIITFSVIDLSRVEIVCSGMLAVMAIFWFTGLSFSAVGRTAQQVVWEVRRQLRSRPGIMEGTERPDYQTCVAIVTRASLRFVILSSYSHIFSSLLSLSEMAKPALIALLLPIAVGITFRTVGNSVLLSNGTETRPLLGVEAVCGFIAFGSFTGLLMAIFLDNMGGAFDNAKKLIESQGQKGTEVHKAAVTGDTVGDVSLFVSLSARALFYSFLSRTLTFL